MPAKKHYIITQTPDETCNPMFEFQIDADAPLIQFTLHSIPEDKREWFAEVMERALFDAFWYGRRSVRAAFKTHIQGLLELVGLYPWK